MVPPSAAAPEQPPVLSVTELSELLRLVVEHQFPRVWVSGEISNLVRAGSGHLYFTLKDTDAQIKAVMWRSSAQRVKFRLHDGLQVIAAGPIEVYPPRGQYQLVVDQLQPQGIGALELALRQLQQKLEAEGLFDPARKRPLPRFPRRIALVTSPSGAAVRDMLQVILRRWPTARVLLLPVLVQGPEAAPQIARALAQVGQIPDVDVVITGRGGGSLEDLWAFNEELVVRAIAACPVPVISAVGHEIDVTLADLVADRRALTPSEAGELVVPRESDVRDELASLSQRLAAALTGHARRARMQLDALASRRGLTRPFDRIEFLRQRVDDSQLRLERAIRNRLRQAQDQVAASSQALHALSPLAVLDRGYSLTKRIRDGHVVRDAREVAPGEQISTLLASGAILSRVEEIDTED